MADPVIGCTVVVKGQKDGVITDLDGNFTISVSGSRVQLEFSYIGYKKKTVDVGDLGVINVKMESDNQLLSEVVVVWCGITEKGQRHGFYHQCKRYDFESPQFIINFFFCR